MLVLGAMLAGCNTLAGSGIGSTITTSVLALWLASLSLVGFLVGCGGGSHSGSFNAGEAATNSSTTTTTGTVTPNPTPTPGLGIPSKLNFQTQPTKEAGKSEAFTPITPAPQVAILDIFGNVVTTATNPVTIGLGTNPGNAVLRGTLTVNAVNGVATFTDLQISQAGAGYTLVAAAAGLTGTESAVFTVGPLSYGYQATLQFMTGAQDSTDLAIGDFNHDGIPDVVAVDNYREGVVAMLGNGDGTFKAPQFSPGAISQGATQLITGDVNRDGLDDVIVASYSAYRATVLLSLGDGTFHAPVNTTLVNGPIALALGDLDGDQVPDLAVAEYQSADVMVMKGKGDGTFAPPVYGQTGRGPNSLVIADLDGDGHLDIATGNYRDDNVSVLLGNGDLTFKPRADFAVTNEPDLSISAVDVNGDGKLDLEVGGYYDPAVSILLGNGDGTFGSPSSLSLGFDPYTPLSMVVADFSGDGKPDIAYVGGGIGSRTKGGPPRHPAPGKVASKSLYSPLVAGIFVGNGDGTFAPGPALVPGASPVAIVAADLRGDGRLDLLTVGNDGSDPFSNVSVLLANADHTFQQTAQVRTEAGAASSAITDMNGDGVPDLVVANVGGDNVSVLLGKGDGTFLPAVNYPSGGGPFYVTAADLNADGIPDLAVGTLGGDVVVLPGNGDGTLKAAVNYAAGGEVEALVTGDFNGDGRIDIVAADYDGNDLVLLPGNGDGTFASEVVIALPFSAPASLATADLNGDGHLDLVTGGESAFAALLGKGDGTFSTSVNLATTDDFTDVVINDMNGDGNLDVVAAGFSDHLDLFLGKGDGTFQAPINVLVNGAFQLFGLGVGDINADGIPDIVAGDYKGNEIIPLLGNGDGTFVRQTGLATGPRPAGVTIGDLNGDEKIDFVSADYGSIGVSIMLHR
jgi:hypothetical protein